MPAIVAFGGIVGATALALLAGPCPRSAPRGSRPGRRWVTSEVAVVADAARGRARARRVLGWAQGARAAGDHPPDRAPSTSPSVATKASGAASVTELDELAPALLPGHAAPERGVRERLAVRRAPRQRAQDPAADRATAEADSGQCRHRLPGRARRRPHAAVHGRPHRTSPPASGHREADGASGLRVAAPRRSHPPCARRARRATTKSSGGSPRPPAPGSCPSDRFRRTAADAPGAPAVPIRCSRSTPRGTQRSPPRSAGPTAAADGSGGRTPARVGAPPCRCCSRPTRW